MKLNKLLLSSFKISLILIDLKTKFHNGNLYKSLELIVLFIGIPLIYYFDFIPFHKSIPLLTIFLIFLIVLLKDKKFDRKRFGFNKFRNWKPILLRFGVFVVISTFLVWIISPEYLFILPKERTFLWLMILLFYPLWSAFPQELIYRTYFFHRYGKLFKRNSMLFLINAALFSFSHIIFENWLAIFLTFFGGIMFASTYQRSNSLMVVFIEHMLYGSYIFTVGIGQYFYAS